MNAHPKGQTLRPLVRHSVASTTASPPTLAYNWSPTERANAKNVLRATLHIMGNDTRTAFNAEEAVAAAEAFRPDALVIDIEMPNMNGYEACRRIRSEPRGQRIVTIAQSGLEQEDQQRMSQEAGFTSHGVKPVDPATLETLLAGARRRWADGCARHTRALSTMKPGCADGVANAQTMIRGRRTKTPTA